MSVVVVDNTREVVYLSAKFEARPRMRAIRQALIELGYDVQAGWLDEAVKEGYALLAEENLADARAIAQRGLEEVANCDLLILDTFDDNNRGGREVEWGIGLFVHEVSDDGGPECWVVGPRCNVFHSLASQHYDTWDACWRALARRRMGRFLALSVTGRGVDQ